MIKTTNKRKTTLWSMRGIKKPSVVKRHLYFNYEHTRINKTHIKKGIEIIVESLKSVYQSHNKYKIKNTMLQKKM